MIKALTRSWENRSRARDTRLKLGPIAALERLKGLEEALTMHRGRASESEGSIHKREWDAAGHTDRAMTARGNSDYISRIREEVAARPNDGGPIVQAAGSAGAPSELFQEDIPSSRRVQAMMDASAFLLPIAAALLLASYQPRDDPSSQMAALPGYDALDAAGLGSIMGVGILTEGRPLSEGVILAVSALMANSSYRNSQPLAEAKPDLAL